MDNHVLVFLLLAGALPLLLNLVLTPLLLHVAHRRSWYDDVDQRKIHRGKIPRIGGMGIFTASFAAIAVIAASAAGTPLFPNLSTGIYLPLLISLALIHVVGLLDDFVYIRPLYKLFGQIAAALIPVLTGIHFSELYLPFFHTTVQLSWFGPVLTLLWILGVTNALNLIDGIDGLSASLSIIATLFLALCSLIVGNLPFAGISFAVAGATIAFFLFNYPPAKLFMGDSGSLYLGYLLALLPILVFNTPRTAGLGLPVGMTLLLVPVLDTIAAIVRRHRQKRPFHIPDMEHLHHKLMKFGFSPRGILSMISAVSLLPALSVYAWLRFDVPLLGDLTFVLWITIALGFIVIDRLNRRMKFSLR